MSEKYISASSPSNKKKYLDHFDLELSDFELSNFTIKEFTWLQ
jgi:hypothetical protein